MDFIMIMLFIRLFHYFIHLKKQNLARQDRKWGLLHKTVQNHLSHLFFQVVLIAYLMVLFFLFRITIRSILLPYFEYTDSDYTNKTYWFFDNYLGKITCLIVSSNDLGRS